MSTVLTSDQRVALLREQLSDPAGPRSDSRSARLLRRSPAANVLIGVTLHAAARREQGLELTGLEQRLTDQFACLFGEEVLAEFGRVYREPASRSAAAALFPALITERSLTEGVDVWDMQDFLPTIEAEIAGLPGVRTVSAEELAAGALTGEEDVVLVTGAPVEDTEDEVWGYEARVRFVRFRCDRGHNGAGGDEIHWMSAAADDSAAQILMVASTHTGVDTGMVRDFGPGAYWFKGAAERFVVGNIQVWEGRNSASDDVRAVLADIARNFAVYGLEYGPTWDAALHRLQVAATAALVNWILSLNKDDFVAQKTIAFSPAALARLADTDNGLFELPAFDGGTEGKHTLTLEVSFARVVAAELNHSIFYNNAWSTPVRVPYLFAATRPSMVSHGGDLYAAYIDSSNDVMLARYNGESWGTPIRASFPDTKRVRGEGNVAVTLLSHAGNLYAYWKSTDDGRRHLSTIDTANGWLTTVTTQRSHGFTAPALLSHGGKIYLITTSDGGTVSVLEAAGWRELGTMVPGEQPSDALTPAAVSYQGRAWVYYISEQGDSCQVVSSADPGAPVPDWRSEPRHANVTVPSFSPSATVAVMGAYDEPRARMACTVAAGRFGTQPFNTRFFDAGGTSRTLITDWGDLRQGQSIAAHHGTTHMLYR